MSETTANPYGCNAMVEAFRNAWDFYWDAAAVSIFDECLTRLTKAAKPDVFYDDFRTKPDYVAHLAAAKEMLCIFGEWSRDPFGRGSYRLTVIPRRLTAWMKAGDAAHWEAEFAETLAPYC